MAYGDAHKAAMDWLSNQWFSQWQINDAIDKVRQQRSSGMSNSDIMSDVRKNTWDYFWGRPMYNPGNTMNWYLWEDSSYDAYDDYEEPPKKTWEELHPATTQKLNWEDYSFQSHEDGSITVSTWNLNKIFKKWDKLYDIANNFMNWISSKQTSTNPNATNAESGLWDQAVSARDSKAYENYDNAYQYYKSQWMSNEDAAKRAEYWLDNDTMSKSKQDKEAEISSSVTKDDETPEWTVIDWIFDNEEWEWTPDTDTSNTDKKDVNWLNWEENWNNMSDDEKNEVIQIALQQMWFTPYLESNSTKSNVVENKAQVSKDPIFDYQTYFRDNLSAPENQGRTGQVKNKIEQGPLTNVNRYDEETTTALQNLWFLQPDTQAAESMPDTVEETAPKMVDNPEQLINEFDSKMDEMANTTGITPQAVATTYTDYKNQLAKYIRENKISDEEAAAMFDQLKKNEKFRSLLTQTNK